MSRSRKQPFLAVATASDPGKVANLGQFEDQHKHFRRCHSKVSFPSGRCIAPPPCSPYARTLTSTTHHNFSTRGEPVPGQFSLKQHSAFLNFPMKLVLLGVGPLPLYCSPDHWLLGLDWFRHRLELQHLFEDRNNSFSP